MCNEQEAGRKAEGNKPKNLLAMYDLLLRQFHSGADNYFRRTQILMIVAQTGLFLAYAKLLSAPAGSTIPERDVFIFVIPLLGFAAALFWREMIKRQYAFMELCRYYMRHIEHKLGVAGVPFGYFTDESKVFHGKKCIYLEADGRKFPYDGIPAKGGIMKLEGGLTVSLSLVWLSLFVFRALLKMRGLLPAFPVKSDIALFTFRFWGIALVVGLAFALLDRSLR